MQEIKTVFTLLVEGLGIKYGELECGSMPNVIATQPNIGSALCESSATLFLVPCRKVWLTPAAGVPCSNAANIGERKTWT